MRRTWILMAATLVVLAACTSDGASPEPSVATPSPTTTTTSLAPSTTTSTTIPDTVPPTTTTTEPPPPTTTLEDAIRQAVQDYQSAYWTCGITPEACNPDIFTAAQGHSRAVLHEFVSSLIAKGLHFSADGRGSFLNVETVTISGTQAVAVSCLYDAGAVLGPPGPDGQPTIVADGIESIRKSNTLFLEGGRWLVAEEQRLETLDEGQSCAAG